MKRSSCRGRRLRPHEREEHVVDDLGDHGFVGRGAAQEELVAVQVGGEGGDSVG